MKVLVRWAELLLECMIKVILVDDHLHPTAPGPGRLRKPPVEIGRYAVTTCAFNTTTLTLYPTHETLHPWLITSGKPNHVDPKSQTL